MVDSAIKWTGFQSAYAFTSVIANVLQREAVDALAPLARYLAGALASASTKRHIACGFFGSSLFRIWFPAKGYTSCTAERSAGDACIAMYSMYDDHVSNCYFIPQDDQVCLNAA